MDLLNRFTLRSRLWGASALLLLVFLAFGLFSLQKMQELDRITWQLYDHPFQVSNAALKAALGVSNMQNGVRQVILARSDSEMATAIQEIHEAERLAFDNLEIIKNRILGDPGKELEHETRNLLESRVRINREIVQLVQEGNKATAVTLTLGLEDQLMERLQQRLLELRNYAGKKAQGFMQESGDRQREIYQRTIFFLAVAALLALLIASFLIRNSLADLNALKGTMAAITSTGRLAKAAISGTNEITDMARHFNGLVDRLQFQFWLKDGLGALNRELPGDLAAGQLAARGLNFICRYVEACAGALYAHDDSASCWELKASFALGEGAYFTRQFQNGAGIVGQVAAERRAIFLKDITREEAVVLSGTVSEPPRSLYAVPLLYQGELTGVLEVASFTGLDLSKREFLDAAAYFLSMALTAATQRDHIQKLLHSTQEANEELTVANEELQVQSEELQAQAEELHSQAGELERQRLKVEEADRLKSEFLSTMSHELRTPLNSVLTLTQLMLARGTGRDTAKEAEYLQVIERNGRHLLHLINDILDISRIESGRVQLTLSRIDPRETCARALETVRPLATERGLELTDSYENLPPMYTDADKLHQILINLLSNAVKFTDRGKIELQVTGVGDRVQFVVRDTGVGIASGVLPHIFDKFRQADGSSTRRFDGTGLGLAICQSLVKILGGEITVVSEVGRGSTFTVTLPEHTAGPQEGVAPPSPPPPLPAVPRPLPGRAQPLILIVEDNPVAALQISTVVEELGYAVQVSAGGAEALANLSQLRPDAIILDLMMPDMDGFQFLEHIRALPKIAATPVLVLTAKELTRADRDRLTHYHIQQLAQKGSLNRRELAESIRQLLRPPAPSRAPAACKSDGLILVVEDNEDNLLAIGAILHEAGYEYVTVTDSRQALAVAQQARPALVLMDIQLSGVSGLELARRLKADPQLAGTPIIALTALAMPNQREEILQAGLDDYLAKPFEPGDLIEIVCRWLGEDGLVSGK